jgi:hypothetical protein
LLAYALLWDRAPVILRRVLSTLALLVVSAWTLHTIVLTGNTLLGQHPIAMLRSSPTQSHQQPPGGYLQAIVAADQMLPRTASVAVVNRTNFVQLYAYYWATYRMYPLRPVMADTTQAAAALVPDYILDIRDPQQPAAAQPPGYTTVNTSQYSDGTVMTVLAHA